MKRGLLPVTAAAIVAVRVMTMYALPLVMVLIVLLTLAPFDSDRLRCS